MKPKVTLESFGSKKFPEFEIGTLVYHKDTPNIIIMCTNIQKNYINGIVIYCPNSSHIGEIVEYLPSALVIVNGKITLEQSY